MITFWNLLVKPQSVPADLHTMKAVSDHYGISWMAAVTVSCLRGMGRKQARLQPVPSRCKRRCSSSCHPWTLDARRE